MKSEVLFSVEKGIFLCLKTNIHCCCSLSFCSRMKFFLHSKMITLTSCPRTIPGMLLPRLACSTFFSLNTLSMADFVHSHFTCPSYTRISPKLQTHIYTHLLCISSWMPHRHHKLNTPQAEVIAGFTPPLVPACQSHVPPVCSSLHWKAPPAALMSLHSPPLYILVSHQFLHIFVITLIVLFFFIPATTTISHLG